MPKIAVDAGSAVASFGRVAAAVVAGERRDHVLDMIVAAVRELVTADLVAITLQQPDGNLATVAADGVDADVYRHRVYPADGTSTEQVLRTGEVIVVDDLSAVPVIGARLPGVALGPTAFVPVVIGGPYGVLSVSRLVGADRFDDRELDLVASFARQAALVVERDSERRRVAELDRIADHARIAAELQDTAVGEIFAASFMLSRLAGETEADQRAVVLESINALDHAIKLIREATLGSLNERLD